MLLNLRRSDNPQRRTCLHHMDYVARMLQHVATPTPDGASTILPAALRYPTVLAAIPDFLCTLDGAVLLAASTVDGFALLWLWGKVCGVMQTRMQCDLCGGCFGWLALRHRALQFWRSSSLTHGTYPLWTVSRHKSIRRGRRVHATCSMYGRGPNRHRAAASNFQDQTSSNTCSPCIMSYSLHG